MSYELILGDCLEVMRGMPAGSVDAIITDLPYGTTACAWDTVIPFAPMWEAVKHVLKPRGAFVTTASQPFTSALVMSNPKWFKYAWVWNKVSPTGFLDTRKKPMKCHEDILVFGNGQSTYNPQLRAVSKPFKRQPRKAKTDTPYREGIGEDYQVGVGYPRSWVEFMRPNNLTGGGVHPTQKPVALYAYLIRTYTNEGDTVLDMTMGSGTTGVAALQTGRRFVGIEIDEGYFKVAQRRIEQAAMQQRLPLGDV